MINDRGCVRLYKVAKLLRIRDKFLLGLALAGDYLLPALIRAGRGLPPRELYSWAGEKDNYHKQTFYNETWKLFKTGEIEKVIIKGQPVLRLTNKGERKLERIFPLIELRNKKWDNQWTLVIFDFPEKERYLREYLRKKLLNLNFGCLQKSNYISPYDFSDDLVQFLAEKRLLGKVFVLRVQHRLMGDAQKLANRVWKLEDFNRNYWKIINKAEKLKRKLEKKKIIKKEEINSLKQNYLLILSQDPFLPYELLPGDWAETEAYESILELENLLI